MKTQIRQLLILSFLFIQSVNLFSQNSNDFTIIIPGKIYKFVLSDENQFIGKAISVDSASVIIITEEKITMSIPQNRIRYFTNDLSPSKYKFLVSLSGGTILYTSSTGYSQTKFGQDYQLSGFYFLSETRAIKIDMRFSYIAPKYPDQGTYYGGNTSMYTIKANFLTGFFKPQNKLIAYISAGIGVCHYIQNEFGDNDGYYSFTVPEINKVNVVFSIGASLGYRFSKNFGVAGELEFNYFSNKYEYILYGAKNQLSNQSWNFLCTIKNRFKHGKLKCSQDVRDSSKILRYIIIDLLIPI